MSEEKFRQLIKLRTEQGDQEGRLRALQGLKSFRKSQSGERVEQAEGGGAPSEEPQEKPLTGRPARRQRFNEISQAKEQAPELLRQIEAGESSAFDLTDRQLKAVKEFRLNRIPELAEVGVAPFVGAEGAEGLGTSAALATSLNPEESAKILQENYPQVAIVYDPKGAIIAVNRETNAQVQLNRPGFSTTDALQGLGLVAAFAYPAQAAAKAPAFIGGLLGAEVAAPLALKAATGVAGSAALETGIQAGQEAAGGDFDASDVAISGALGGAGELVGPAIKGGIQKFQASRRAGQETAEQAARREVIEKTLGVPPTRAQVTRSPEEFSQQQSIIKGSTGKVRELLDAQEEQFAKVLDDAAARTGGNVASSTSTPIDEVVNRSLTLDDNIVSAYKAAREEAGDSKIVTINSLKGALDSLDPIEDRSKGTVSALRKTAKKLGFLSSKERVSAQSLLVRKRHSVAAVENLRQFANGLFEGANPQGRRAIRAFKAALDKDVEASVGRDIFKGARQSVIDFEASLSSAGVSKFDSRKKNLVRDMLENAINPDTFTKDVMTSKSWRSSDVSQLKNYLEQTPSGTAALNDLRAESLDLIKEKSFSSNGELKGAGFVRAVDGMGDKLGELLTPQDVDLLNRLKEVVKIRTPGGREALGSGPSGQAIEALEKKVFSTGSLAMDVIIRPILSAIGKHRKNKFLLSLPKSFSEPINIPDLNLPAGVSQTPRQLEDNSSAE